MASIVGQLKVKIGGDLSELDRALRASERAVKQAGNRLGSAADSLTNRFSLPFAALAGISVKFGGELEAMQNSMKTTFESAGRSAGAAATEVDNLRKSAMAPGLDFQQAIQASTRLQNVRMSAEEARNLIEQLANAVAMAGGSAESLGAVTRQMTQMKAKGRVLQEDLTIMLENMPVLARVMQDTFGTVSAEAIRAAGVNADQFIAKITDGLEKLPRAAGGISNSIVNAMSGMQLAAAEFGLALNEALNVSGRLDAFGTWIVSLAQGFKALDGDTKRMVIGIGVFAAALGPAIYAARAMVQGFMFMRISAINLQATYTALTATNGGLAASFIALDRATKLTIIGGIVGVALAAAAAFYALRQELSATEVAQRTLQSISQEADKTILEEKLAVEKLAKTINDETKSKIQKKAAIEALQKLSPEIFKNLDTERIKQDQVNISVDRYIQQIKKRAELAALNQKLIETEKALFDAQNGINVSTTVMQDLYSEAAAMLSKFGDKQISVAEAQRIYAKENGQELVPALNATKDAIAQKIEQLEKETKVTASNAKENAGNKETLEERTKRLKEAQKAEEEYWQEMDKTIASLEEWNEQSAKATIGEIKRMNPELAPLPGAWEKDRTREVPDVAGNAVKGVTDLAAAQDTLGSSIGRVSEQWNGWIQKMGVGQSISESVLSSIQNLSAQGVVSFRKMGQAALYSAVQVAKAKMIEGIFATVSSALSTIPFPFNIAAAGLAAGGAAALLNGLTSRIHAPALAKGGLAYEPTLAVVGDNRGASADPEVIAPLSDLTKIMGNAGGGNMIASIKVDGRDFYIMLEKARQQLGRTV